MNESARERAMTGMQCPVCHVDLVMSERQGIEVDYCPRCRGVWLDRGELDKIVERSTSSEPPRSERAQAREYRPDRDHDDRRDYDDRRGYDDRYRSHGHRRKKKSWLGEIFEFD